MNQDLKVMDILKKHGFHFKKKFGQNFILDTNLLKKIAAGADLKPGESVVEIGPGAGTLTRALAETGAKVLAIEIDRELLPVLNEVLAGSAVTIVNQDVLKIDLDELTKEQGLSKPYKIVANLPYYITTPIIMDVLEKEYEMSIMVIMVQWEVAERLTARPGTKEYGMITLAIQYYCQARVLFKVPRHLFTPAPAVDSAVILLEKRSAPPVQVQNKELLFKIIKAAFGQRRKTLQNALSNLAPQKEGLLKVLKMAEIEGNRRGETLSLEEFARLANLWQQGF